MFCTRCGTKLEAGSHFCSGCGAALEAPPVAADPMPGPAYAPPAPKKKGRWLPLLMAAGATLLILVIVLVIVLSGSSPEDVVEEYLEAEFEGDQAELSELRGFDPWTNFITTVYDLDDEIEDIEDDLIWYENETDLDLDFDYWHSRLYRIRDERDFYKFWLDYCEAEAEALVEAHHISYEILSIATYRLHNTEMRDARSSLKSSYEYWEEWNNAPEYDIYEIDAFYEVDVAMQVEYDGEIEIIEQTMLVVEAHGQYYIAYSNWYGQ